MCDCPTLVKNPYFRADPRKGLNYLHDCESQYMAVPCHHCPSCIATQQMYILQRFQMEALDNYIYFATLTYDNEHLPFVDVNGYSIDFAYFKHFTDMIKRIRKNDLFTRPFSYFAVSEFGSSRGRPHFHALFFLPKYSEDSFSTPYNLESILYETLFNQWAVNVGSRTMPKYESLFTFQARISSGRIFKNFDLHFVKPLEGFVHQESVCFYVMKYLLKDSKRASALQSALRLNLSLEEYNEIWNLVKPHSQFSKHFGFGFNFESDSKPSDSVLKHIKYGIAHTPIGSPYPVFVNPIDGKTFPLSPYYQRNCLFYTLSDALPILMNADRDSFYNFTPDDFYQSVLVNYHKYEKHLKMIEENSNPCLNY